MKRLSMVMLATIGLHCAPAEDTRPNFLVILADDLGFSDLGLLGSEIRTPHLDALAAEGVLLTNYHVASSCAPTRAMLLTGMDPHPVGIGSQGASSDPNQQGQYGYEGYMTDRVVNVAAILRNAGYHTSTVGKWHLGGEDHLLPHNRGFERSFGVAAGGVGHFGDAAPMLEGYPNTYRDDGLEVTIPEDFFSTDYFTDKLLSYLEESTDQNRPFFMFAAYTAPHWPLQAPDDYIDRYAGRYDDGYDALRHQRVQHLVEQRVVPDVPTPSRLPWVPAWDQLSDEQKRFEARRMEIYAAMVENLDHNIGRLVEYLKQSGRFDNTLIVFSSDNGAEGNDIGELAGRDWVESTYDLSYENMGRSNSYVWRGAGWAQAQTAPFNLFKAFTTEGGVRTPAIITCGTCAPRRSDAFVSAMDVVPTILDIARVAPPFEWNGEPVEPMQGKSMLAFLRGRAERVHDVDEVIGWESFGRRAVYRGGWKLVFTYEPYGPGRWQLFDLDNDPAETRDLTESEPEQLAEMLAAWDEYAATNRVIIPTGDRGYGLIEEARNQR